MSNSSAALCKECWYQQILRAFEMANFAPHGRFGLNAIVKVRPNEAGDAAENAKGLSRVKELSSSKPQQDFFS